MMRLCALLLVFACGFACVNGGARDLVKDATVNLPAPTIQVQDSLDQRLGELSKQITSKIEAGQKKTIAILEFTDLQGNVTDFGRYVAEELITRLYDTGKFKVIERQLLNQIIREQKLSLTGIVDPASAKKLGSILGVDAIVSGTIADRGESLKVNARLISSETGEIFSAAAAEVTKDGQVSSLMNSAGPGKAGGQGSQSKADGPALKVVVGVFRFELERCQLTGDELTCTIIVTNDSEIDRKFNLFGRFYFKEKSSSALDSSAREYSPSSVRIGNGQINNAVSSLLIPQGPVKIVLAFKDIPSDIALLKFLRVAFNENYNSNGRYADFRNVPVSK